MATLDAIFPQIFSDSLPKLIEKNYYIHCFVCDYAHDLYRQEVY